MIMTSLTALALVFCSVSRGHGRRSRSNLASTSQWHAATRTYDSASLVANRPIGGNYTSANLAPARSVINLLYSRNLEHSLASPQTGLKSNSWSGGDKLWEDFIWRRLGDDCAQKLDEIRERGEQVDEKARLEQDDALEVQHSASSSASDAEDGLEILERLTSNPIGSGSKDGTIVSQGSDRLATGLFGRDFRPQQDSPIPTFSARHVNLLTRLGLRAEVDMLRTMGEELAEAESDLQLVRMAEQSQADFVQRLDDAIADAYAAASKALSGGDEEQARALLQQRHDFKCKKAVAEQELADASKRVVSMQAHLVEIAARATKLDQIVGRMVVGRSLSRLQDDGQKDGQPRKLGYPYDYR